MGLRVQDLVFCDGFGGIFAFAVVGSMIFVGCCFLVKEEVKNLCCIDGPSDVCL